MKTPTMSLLLKTAFVCTVAALAATAAQANDTVMRDMQSQFGLVQNQIQNDESEQTDDAEEEGIIRTLGGCGGVGYCPNQLIQIAH